LCHLFDEQRNPVGALDDIPPDIRWQRLATYETVDHGNDVARRQPIDRDGRHVRSSDPRWLEFRSECHDQHHRKSLTTIPSPAQTEPLQAPGVGPMSILKDHEHWTLMRLGLHL